MKSLKVLLIAATIAGANVALAQEKSTTTNTATKQASTKTYETPDEIAAKQTSRVNTICGLTADQETKIKAIYLQSDDAVRASNKAAGKDKAKADADKNKLLEERRNQVDAVLTPDQRKKMEAAYKANNGKPIDADVK